MRLLTRIIASAALAAALGGCSLGGLLGGGGKPPVTLQTLTPQAPDPGAVVRAANAGEAVTIATPTMPKELRTVRVPAQISPTDIQYVTNLQWVDTPDRLFQDLLAETVRRTTNRVVLDPSQPGFDPGLMVSGQLQRFGYDASSGQVVVVYDGSLSTAGGSRVEARRFTASVRPTAPARASGRRSTAPPTRSPREVAKWIGG